MPAALQPATLFDRPATVRCNATAGFSIAQLTDLHRSDHGAMSAEVLSGVRKLVRRDPSICRGVVEGD